MRNITTSKSSDRAPPASSQALRATANRQRRWLRHLGTAVAMWGLLLAARPASSASATLSLAYQGIGSDKGIGLQLTLPSLLSDRSGLFVEVSGNETAGVPTGKTEAIHAHYLLWNAGWCWETTVTPGLSWTWLVGAGMTIPTAAVEDSVTPSATLRTGLEHAFAPSWRSFLELGIQMNVWNRATAFAGQPYYARGTTGRFGVRYAF